MRHLALCTAKCQSITICYDSDKAGIEAAFRAGNISRSRLSNESCLMSDGLDPDEYIKRMAQKNSVMKSLSASLTWMAFKFLYFRRGKNLKLKEISLPISKIILKEISQLTKAVERDHYLRQLASEFSLSLRCFKAAQKQIFFRREKKSTWSKHQPVISPVRC